jgi:hypothetical protein
MQACWGAEKAKNRLKSIFFYQKRPQRIEKANLNPRQGNFRCGKAFFFPSGKAFFFSST